MLRWAAIFLVIALVAGLLGFAGVAGAAAGAVAGGGVAAAGSALPLSRSRGSQEVRVMTAARPPSFRMWGFFMG